APGRTTKVALLALVALVVAVGAEPELAGVALVVGAGAGLLPADLGERLMLGDAGTNVLGAVLGLGVVVTCGPTARTAVLVVVALLNLVSEQVSFSRVIAAVPPLRALDRWGRLPLARPGAASGVTSGDDPRSGGGHRVRLCYRDKTHLRHGRGGQLPRQGHLRVVARSAPQGTRPARDHAEARPLHQRRPGDDEPVRARRGVRHRRRRRDRPRPRALRALHRRVAVP